jgi:divalent metal cation (Fe/Co/Zn/Cd) transporter
MPHVAQRAPLTDADRLRQRGRRLLYATVIWNAVEGTTALGSGLIAGSVALTAFGLDSSVEMFVSLVAVWHLGRATSLRTRLGLRLIGASFLIVALYVAAEAVRRLYSGEHARLSVLGFVVTSAAVPIMVSLGLMKRRVAHFTADSVLGADAKFSFVDAGLSATVLLGLALDQGMGVWWADSAIAIVVAVIAAYEGVEGLRGAP